ncbi:MAG: hypothetical protein ABI557_00875 [Aureliella sp.]
MPSLKDLQKRFVRVSNRRVDGVGSSEETFVIDCRSQRSSAHLVEEKLSRLVARDSNAASNASRSSQLSVG